MAESYEQQYRTLVRSIIDTGAKVPGRNGDTRSLMGVMLTCDLTNEFPILTGRRVPWRSVVEELLWMMRGETDTTKLWAKGVHIWDANSTREFLDARGLTDYVVGDIGPSYGWQLRRFGAPYIPVGTKLFDDEKEYPGFDQLCEVIRLLRTDPYSRRIKISMWNPAQTAEMALPPCHDQYQWLVRDGYLNCFLTQRSWDVALGWNTTTAALLTHILAGIVGLKVGMLKHYAIDAHVYEEHISTLTQEYLPRTPFPAPRLKIHEGVNLENFDNLTADDFTLCNYQAHPPIKMKMKA